MTKKNLIISHHHEGVHHRQLHHQKQKQPSSQNNQPGQRYFRNQGSLSAPGLLQPPQSPPPQRRPVTTTLPLTPRLRVRRKQKNSVCCSSLLHGGGCGGGSEFHFQAFICMICLQVIIFLGVAIFTDVFFENNLSSFSSRHHSSSWFSQRPFYDCSQSGTKIPLIIGGSDGSGTRAFVDVIKQLGVMVVADDKDTFDLHAAALFQGQGWPALVTRILKVTHTGNYEWDDLPTSVQSEIGPQVQKLVSHIEQRCSQQHLYRHRPQRPGASVPPPSEVVDIAGLLSSDSISYGIKAPVSMLTLPVLTKFMGGRIKFLHVLRDGRDVALSSNQSPVMKFYNVSYIDPIQKSQLKMYNNNSPTTTTTADGNLSRVKAMQLWNDWNIQVNNWGINHHQDQEEDPSSSSFHQQQEQDQDESSSNNIMSQKSKITTTTTTTITDTNGNIARIDYLVMRSEDLLNPEKRLECLQKLAEFVGSTISNEQLCCMSRKAIVDYGKSHEHHGDGSGGGGKSGKWYDRHQHKRPPQQQQGGGGGGGGNNGDHDDQRDFEKLPSLRQREEHVQEQELELAQKEAKLTEQEALLKGQEFELQQREVALLQREQQEEEEQQQQYQHQEEEGKILIIKADSGEYLRKTGGGSNTSTASLVVPPNNINNTHKHDYNKEEELQQLSQSRRLTEEENQGQHETAGEYSQEGAFNVTVFRHDFYKFQTKVAESLKVVDYPTLQRYFTRCAELKYIWQRHQLQISSESSSESSPNINTSLITANDFFELMNQLELQADELKLQQRRANKKVEDELEVHVEQRYGKWMTVLAQDIELSRHFHEQGAAALKLFGYEPHIEKDFSLISRKAISNSLCDNPSLTCPEKN